MNADISIDRLTATLGAEVHGLALNRVDDDTIETIESLLHEHRVLFFPGQFLGIEEHVDNSGDSIPN